ncbi:MAG TPA: glycosyl hydrolase, partial [Sphingobacterium sp.]|nr:glycosyl hydrolase [Sphingobacterium sp.]
SRLREDGTLVWDVPPGDWMVVRTGHRMTGSRLSIPQPEADGLSVGWLNSEGVVRQFEHLGKILLAEAKKEDYDLHFFCDDSFEDGFPNWTTEILKKFVHYRGYDPTLYLPALSGYLVGSTDITNRFLHDYRKTVADCMADAHYRKFAELCHANGLLVQNEAAGPSRSGTMCMDGLKNLGRSDLPAGEFWLGIRHDEEGGLSDTLSYGESRLEGGQNKVCKMVASAAHIYGKTLVSAEAYTSYRHWQDSPGSLKQATDRAFCEGINRIMIHTSSATRPKDGKPGYEYYAGTHFNPNVTWWEYAKGFLTYIARCQHMLRKGRFVADVLFYNGDGAPNVVEPKHINPLLGEGYDYDVCNEEVLLTRLSVTGGLLTLPDGMQYKLLVLPESEMMPEAVLKKVRSLVMAGATVIGKPPVQDSGLLNFPAADNNIKTIVSELWGNCDGLTQLVNYYGKGRVFWGKPVRDILLTDGVLPDFIADLGAETVDFIHREDELADIYFVANRTGEVINPLCSFRKPGYIPEIWDPVKGEKVVLKRIDDNGNHVRIPLKLYPFQSYFVIFSKKSKGLQATLSEHAFETTTAVQKITGAWDVAFDPAWGAPSQIIFDQLQDWSQHHIDGIKYYSGKAIYTKDIRIDGQILSYSQVFITLGVVKDIAHVRFNGKDMGVVWTSPWQIDVTDVVKKGLNKLEISVINLWPNRLIGDAGLPLSERFTRTNITLKKDQKLLSSGLLGPVTIEGIA